MNDVKIDRKSFFYPPGGILIWFLVIIELFTFLGAIIYFSIQRNANPELFLESQELLNPIVGTINTIILISSGYLMAMAVHQLKKNKIESTSKYLLFATILGGLFLVIKFTEFYLKMDAGIGFEYSTFFTFYWLMTGFHFIHVLFGVGLLTYMYRAVRFRKYNANEMTDVESSASYWHMCDLIWILIFPVLYLI